MNFNSDTPEEKIKNKKHDSHREQIVREVGVGWGGLDCGWVEGS